MAMAHVLTDIDSLQSLALTYLGDASRWQEIAEYNRLDYPYIIASYDDLTNFFGSGYVTLVRANFVNSATISAGWLFKTKPDSLTGNMIKHFVVTEDVTIPAGVDTYNVPVRCTVPGTFGNIIEYMIDSIDNAANPLAFKDMIITSVYNANRFTGGQDVNVKVSGDTIYIPSDSSETAPDSIQSIIDYIGGSDLIIDTDGDLLFNTGGDLDSVSGAENIKYAVTNRVKAEIGELTLHPEYGTDLPELIGSPSVANRVKLAEVSILRALSLEDRIKDVTIDSIAMDGTTANVIISYKIAVSDTSDSVIITV